MSEVTPVTRSSITSNADNVEKRIKSVEKSQDIANKARWKDRDEMRKRIDIMESTFDQKNLKMNKSIDVINKRLKHFDISEARVKSDISDIKNSIKIMKIVGVAEFAALVAVMVTIAAVSTQAEAEPKNVITMEIDGSPTNLYIDEYDRIYQDADFTVEFPNDNMEPWIYTGDPNMPFRMPVCD